MRHRVARTPRMHGPPWGICHAPGQRGCRAAWRAVIAGGPPGVGQDGGVGVGTGAPHGATHRPSRSSRKALCGALTGLGRAPPRRGGPPGHAPPARREPPGIVWGAKRRRPAPGGPLKGGVQRGDIALVMRHVVCQLFAASQRQKSPLIPPLSREGRGGDACPASRQAREPRRRRGPPPGRAPGGAPAAPAWAGTPSTARPASAPAGRAKPTATMPTASG
jgi:hypothetical protein